MSFDNPRIKNLNMTTMDVLMVMGGGNPGAITVLGEILNSGPIVDPNDFMFGMGAIFGLDTADIYESEIWMFYKDLCKQNIAHMMGMLRAVQLGFLSDKKLKEMIHNGYSYTTEDLMPYLNQVKERLPAFNIDYKVV